MTFSFNSAICIPTDIGLPFDFETSPITSDFSNFNGGTATVEPVATPQDNGNSSTNLVKLVRNGGDIWAGAFLNLDGGLDFSSQSYITLKLWTEAPIGTTVRMKLEQQSNPGNFAEIDVQTQKSGEWETLNWDFSSLGTTVFDRLVFMFDFGNTGNGSATSTFYFDDVQQVATLGVEDFSSEIIKMYPNPVTSVLYIDSYILDLTKVEIFSLLGKKIKEVATELNSINVDELSSGIYFIKAYSGNKHITKKLIKNAN